MSVRRVDQLVLTGPVFNVTAVRSVRVIRDDHNDDSDIVTTVGALENGSGIDVKCQRAFSVVHHTTGNFSTATQTLTTLRSCNSTEVGFNLIPGPSSATLRRIEPSKVLLRVAGSVGCSPTPVYGPPAISV